MKKPAPAAGPDAHVAARDGWRRLTREAVALNRTLEDPTLAAKPGPKR